MSDLETAVHTVVHRCMGVRQDERVLIVCNPKTEALGESMGAVAEFLDAYAQLMSMAERESNAQEPPDEIADAMLAADVVLAPTVQSLSHTEARKNATDKGVRIGTLPGVTEELLARVMSVDLHKLVNRTLQVTEALTVGSDVQITSDNGTDLRLSIEGREAICDAGELSGPGAFGNLPCGEGFISPAEETTNGTLVIDGTIATFGTVKEPVRMEVKDGHLVKAENGIGPEVLDTLTGHGKYGTNVAELGIGTNDKATLTGNVLEDEKILGTAHIAFGASAAIGGMVQVPIHIDCVMMWPTIDIDGHRLVHSGQLRA